MIRFNVGTIFVVILENKNLQFREQKTYWVDELLSDPMGINQMKIEKDKKSVFNNKKCKAHSDHRVRKIQMSEPFEVWIETGEKQPIWKVTIFDEMPKSTERKVEREREKARHTYIVWAYEATVTYGLALAAVRTVRLYSNLHGDEHTCAHMWQFVKQIT